MIYAEEAKQSARLLAIGLHGLPIAIDRDSFRDGEIVGWNIDHALILMQWTGLKDKDGCTIYESDIIQLDNESLFRVIEWSDSGYCMRIPNATARAGICHEECRVVGNIYERPYLLQEKRAT